MLSAFIWTLEITRPKQFDFFPLAVAVFSGHQNSTFYVKSSLSPDDQFLVSGSSDEAAYIWKVSCQTCPTNVRLNYSCKYFFCPRWGKFHVNTHCFSLSDVQWKLLLASSYNWKLTLNVTEYYHTFMARVSQKLTIQTHQQFHRLSENWEFRRLKRNNYFVLLPGKTQCTAFLPCVFKLSFKI